MSVAITPREELLTYRQQLRSWYISQRLSRQLIGVLGYQARTTLDDLKRSVHQRMDQEFQAKGPNDCLWHSLFENRWLSVNKKLDPIERLRRVKDALESVDLNSSDFKESFWAQVNLILVAQPSLKRSSHGFIAFADVTEGDSIRELNSISNDRIAISSVHDNRLSWCLVHSWKFSKDHVIAYAARQALMDDFWNAWDSQCEHVGNEFDQYEFVTSAGLDSEHFATSLDIWTERDGVLHYDRHPNFISFDDEGWCSLGDTDSERRTRVFAVPNLLEQTRQFHQWVEKQHDRGYVGFSRHYWTESGVMTGLMSTRPLMTKIQAFSRSKLPPWTLNEALMTGLRELNLDQVFFSNVLLTRKEYVQRPD